MLLYPIFYLIISPEITELTQNIKYNKNLYKSNYIELITHISSNNLSKTKYIIINVNGNKVFSNFESTHDQILFNIISSNYIYYNKELKLPLNNISQIFNFISYNLSNKSFKFDVNYFDNYIRLFNDPENVNYLLLRKFRIIYDIYMSQTDKPSYDIFIDDIQKIINTILDCSSKFPIVLDEKQKILFNIIFGLSESIVPNCDILICKQSIVYSIIKYFNKLTKIYDITNIYNQKCEIII